MHLGENASGIATSGTRTILRGFNFHRIENLENTFYKQIEGYARLSEGKPENKYINEIVDSIGKENVTGYKRAISLINKLPESISRDPFYAALYIAVEAHHFEVHGSSQSRKGKTSEQISKESEQVEKLQGLKERLIGKTGLYRQSIESLLS